MELLSLSFALFTTLVIALFYLLPHPGRNGVLLAASYAFYALLHWSFPVFLAALTLLNYLLAGHLRRAGRKQPRILWAGILVNVAGVLGLKYFDFFVPQLQRLWQLAGGVELPVALAILFPVGLSYRMLENIAYLVDVYQGLLEPSRKLPDFALYSGYFLKLIAGPIERPGKFLGQLAQPRRIDEATWSRGITLIALGITRKLIIADGLREYVPARFFDNPGDFGAIQLLTILFAYMFILYNDFAGYTDFVRGVSQFFGLELSSNFTQPFFSRTFIEMWLRWHSSLSFWLRDYIFSPLSRFFLRRVANPQNPVNMVVPVLVTLWVSGLWHNLSLPMLIWGTLMGLYLAGGRILRAGKKAAPPDGWPWWRQLRGMWTVTLFFTLAIVPSRMTLANTGTFFAGLADWKAVEWPAFGLVLLLLLSLAIDFCQYVSRNEVVFLAWPKPVRILLAAGVVITVFLSTRAKPATRFVYERF